MDPKQHCECSHRHGRVSTEQLTLTIVKQRVGEWTAPLFSLAALWVAELSVPYLSIPLDSISSNFKQREEEEEKSR